MGKREIVKGRDEEKLEKGEIYIRVKKGNGKRGKSDTDGLKDSKKEKKVDGKDRMTQHRIE